MTLLLEVQGNAILHNGEVKVCREREKRECIELQYHQNNTVNIGQNSNKESNQIGQKKIIN